LKNTLKTKHRRKKKAAHHSIPAFIGGNCRTVEKYLRPNTKKGITKAAHHSIPAFIGRIG
jgi:hypothetical protein